MLLALALATALTLIWIAVFATTRVVLRERLKHERLDEIRLRAAQASYALNNAAFAAQQAIFDAALTAKRNRNR
jgi:hypothetical protein